MRNSALSQGLTGLRSQHDRLQTDDLAGGPTITEGQASTHPKYADTTSRVTPPCVHEHTGGGDAELKLKVIVIGTPEVRTLPGLRDDRVIDLPQPNLRIGHEP